MPEKQDADEARSRKVFVGNVDYQITPDRLLKEMVIAGRVLNCEIPNDKTGRPRGYAIVEFETATAARIAINTMAGLELNGRSITLREDRGKRINLRPSGLSPQPNPSKQGLSNTLEDGERTKRPPRRHNRNRRDYGDATKSQGRAQGGSSGSGSSSTRRRVAHGRKGDVRKSPRVVPAKGTLKGLTSSSSSSSRITDTSRNIESKQNTGRKRQLQRPRIKLDENLQDRLVYYGNLSWSADGANVSEFVGGLSCIIPTDHRGRSKGYALVEYPTDAEALDAVNKFSEVEFLGRRLIARLFVFKSATSSSLSSRTATVPTTTQRKHPSASSSGESS